MWPFKRPEPEPHVRDRLNTLDRQLVELRESLDRRIREAMLHAEKIAEEATRLIRKFERRLDREAPPEPEQSRQDAPGPTNGVPAGYGMPYFTRAHPKGRGNY